MLRRPPAATSAPYPAAAQSTQDPHPTSCLDGPIQHPTPTIHALDPSPSAQLPKRLPQPRDSRGVGVALAVITMWSALYLHALLRVQLWGPQRSSLLHIAAVFCSLEYLYTGLFITTHDAMHGSVAPGARRLNDLLGRVAISLYACFDYSMLHKKHWQHHDHTGRVGADPDFHHGDPALWKWYLQFMAAYATPKQFAMLTVESVATMLLLQVPMANIVVFKAGAGLLSSVRLFYFGTYLPHRPDSAGEEMPWQRSRSSQCSAAVSMLRCYCFEFHWEHHRWPYAPWWQLGHYKRLVRAGKIAL